MKNILEAETVEKMKKLLDDHFEAVKELNKPKINTVITRWDNDSVIYESEKSTVKETLEEGVKKGISFAYANLVSANLVSANLYNANLVSANLYSANLVSANLYNANLVSANLYNANLVSANLYNANLVSADLADANLVSANLVGANLYNAKFYGKGGSKTLSKKQVPVFLKALGFVIEGE